MSTDEDAGFTVCLENEYYPTEFYRFGFYSAIRLSHCYFKGVTYIADGAKTVTCVDCVFNKRFSVGADQCVFIRCFFNEDIYFTHWEETDILFEDCTFASTRIRSYVERARTMRVELSGCVWGFLSVRRPLAFVVEGVVVRARPDAVQ